VPKVLDAAFATIERRNALFAVGNSVNYAQGQRLADPMAAFLRAEPGLDSSILPWH